MIDIPEISESATKNGWVTLLVIISLFCISVGTLAFGTIKVAEGASKLDQPLASMQVGGWHHLK